MPNKKILSESYTEIYMNEDNGILYARWQGFLKVDQVRKGCEAMTEYISKNHVKSHLSDHRRLKVLSKEVQNYLQQTWFPSVEEIGLNKIGAVVAEDVFAKATVDKVNSVQLGKMVINTFDSKTDCEKWLSN